MIPALIDETLKIPHDIVNRARDARSF